MANCSGGQRAGLTEFVCSILVLVFAVLGLAKLADRFDLNVSKNAINAVADNCGNGQQACNSEGKKKPPVAIV